MKRFLTFIKLVLCIVVILGGSLVVNAQEHEQNVPSESSGDARVSKKGEMVILDVLDLKKMDILDVLKLISQKSGLNIVASQNVTGRVTVYLKDIEVIEALKIIVEAYGWVFVKDGDIIKVMAAQDYATKYGHKFGRKKQTRIIQLLFANATELVAILTQVKSESGKIIPDDKSNMIIIVDEEDKVNEMVMIIKNIDVPIETEVFKLSYAKAEELSTKIEEVLTPAVGKIKFDVRSNQIIVTDSKTKIDYVRKIIKAFDQKDKEVLIEAKILQIVLSDEHKMGIDWEAIVSDYHSLNLKSDFDILSSSEKSGKLSIGTLSSDDYTVLIEALDTIGVTDILSSPRITVINNHEAKILVGSTEPYVTTTTTTPASGPTTTAESVNFIEVGVKLYVTPTIHEDSFITMKIKPEVSSVTSNVTTSNNNVIPVVETSEAETTVLVKDGVTIVIGGLIKEEKIKTVKKIPFLGDLPFIKFAFRNESDLIKKTEIVIFLTPKIITGDVETEDLSRVW